jgi:hypothetical protein
MPFLWRTRSEKLGQMQQIPECNELIDRNGVQRNADELAETPIYWPIRQARAFTSIHSAIVDSDPEIPWAANRISF